MRELRRSSRLADDVAADSTDGDCGEAIENQESSRREKRPAGCLNDNPGALIVIRTISDLPFALFLQGWVAAKNG